MRVRNTLGDMHNMLMEQMERLTDADEDIESLIYSEVADGKTGEIERMLSIESRPIGDAVVESRQMTIVLGADA